jgi:hypothetical protein
MLMAIRWLEERRHYLEWWQDEVKQRYLIKSLSLSSDKITLAPYLIILVVDRDLKNVLYELNRNYQSFKILKSALTWNCLWIFLSKNIPTLFQSKEDISIINVWVSAGSIMLDLFLFLIYFYEVYWFVNHKSR